MKHRPSLPDSGVQVENTLSMSLHRRAAGRSRLSLVLLALFGALCSEFTFLTMFMPLCNPWVIALYSAALVLFFCWHEEHPAGNHLTMMGFFLAFVLFFFWQRERLSCGLMYLMNAIYQTIYMTDWEYFETSSLYDPGISTTLLLCCLLIPISWLLSYAVMRYQNFFLAMLVTFPFVEIGFFFGIAPDHLPAMGLFAFWCGMGAVQLASSGTYHPGGKMGFVRNKNRFAPVSGMRFLLTERAGVVTACAVFILTALTNAWLTWSGYERPKKIQQMRDHFITVTSGITWSDLQSMFPFLPEQDSSPESDTVILLGNVERREFEEIEVSGVTFSEMPQGRVYLKYITRSIYDKSSWEILPKTSYYGDIFTYFEEHDIYPQEFVYPAAEYISPGTVEMHLNDPNDVLSLCVPYGFAKTGNILCAADDTVGIASHEYTIYGGPDYEALLALSSYKQMLADVLLDLSPPEHQEDLRALSLGRKKHSVRMPEDSLFAEEMFSDMTIPEETAEAAVLGAACGYSDFVLQHFRTVPSTEEMAEIRAAYSDLFAGYDYRTADPAETMQVLGRIRDRLCAQVTYTVAPGKTPPRRDFVHYFLMENKKGYCTHYATAGTLLARMAGIPARYCEGYLVDHSQLRKDDSGSYSAEILDSNAHAWSEIYIEGMGWIPFEFTFSYFTPPEAYLPKETQPVTEPLPVPTAPMTAPPIESSNTTTTTPAPEIPAIPEEEPLDLTSLLTAVGAAAGVLLLVLSFRLARLIAMRRRARLYAQSDRHAAAEYVWGRFLRMLGRCGVNTQAGTVQALTDDALEKCGRFLPSALLEKAAAAGTKLRYSPHGLDEEEMKLLRRAADTLGRGMYAEAGTARKFAISIL